MRCARTVAGLSGHSARHAIPNLEACAPGDFRRTIVPRVLLGREGGSDSTVPDMERPHSTQHITAISIDLAAQLANAAHYLRACSAESNSRQLRDILVSDTRHSCFDGLSASARTDQRVKNVGSDQLSADEASCAGPFSNSFSCEPREQIESNTVGFGFLRRDDRRPPAGRDFVTLEPFGALARVSADIGCHRDARVPEVDDGSERISHTDSNK